jgi:hypothetical protein
MIDDIVSCHVCRHTFVYRGRQSDLNGNFCSLPCQAWYDAGNASVAVEIVYATNRYGRPLTALKSSALIAAKTSIARACAAARSNASAPIASVRKTWPSWPMPASSQKPNAAVSAVTRLSKLGATDAVYLNPSAFAARSAEDGW